MPEHEKKPKIPWETPVKVDYAGELSIVLKLGTSEITVDWDGSWYGSLDSRKEIKGYMHLDKALTIRIQKDFEESYGRGGWMEWVKNWIRGTKVDENKLGPKDWVPGNKIKKVPFGKIFDYGDGGEGLGSENTYNLDSAYWWGDVFEYTHFLTNDDEEGVVIMWHGGGDTRGNYGLPEVWMGRFGEFYQSQEEGDPGSSDSFLYWNGRYDNTILWAMDELGLFEGRVHMIGNPQEPHRGEIGKGVARATKEQPMMLYPSLIEKILAHENILPSDVVWAAGKRMDQMRFEIEKAHGQRYFWGPRE